MGKNRKVQNEGHWQIQVLKSEYLLSVKDEWYSALKHEY